MKKEEYKAIVLRGLDCAHLNGLISSYDYWKAIDTTQNRIQVYPEESREILKNLIGCEQHEENEHERPVEN